MNFLELPKTIKETKDSLGLPHSFNGEPALIYEDGEKLWFKHDKVHRENGPAIIHSDGRLTWVWEGQKVE